ncbi:MAG TPA: hypothetical protein VLQ20_06805 [Planococcus sp. (in: firmicutes)]|nr:hypothetical protein [Planococcus sp. (in: firmicutes)]
MLVAMTYLLVQDYFPQLMGYAMGKWIAVAVIAALFLSGGFTAKKRSDEKMQAIWMLGSTFYLLALLVLLPLLGGTSSMGISFSNPIIWLLLSITAAQIYFKMTKHKRGVGDEQYPKG